MNQTSEDAREARTVAHFLSSAGEDTGEGMLGAALMRTCPRCGAVPRRSCRSRTGKLVAPHADRHPPRGVFPPGTVALLRVDQLEERSHPEGEVLCFMFTILGVEQLSDDSDVAAYDELIGEHIWGRMLLGDPSLLAAVPDWWDTPVLAGLECRGVVGVGTVFEGHQIKAVLPAVPQERDTADDDDDDWVRQTELGAPYGLSAIAVGKHLVKAGWKDAVTNRPTDAALDQHVAWLESTAWGEQVLWSVTKTADVFAGCERVVPVGSILSLRVDDLELRTFDGRYGEHQRLFFAFRILGVQSTPDGDPSGYEALVGGRIWGSVPARLSNAPDNGLRIWAETLLGVELPGGSKLDIVDLVGRQCRGVVGVGTGGKGCQIDAVLPAVPHQKASAAADRNGRALSLVRAG